MPYTWHTPPPPGTLTKLSAWPFRSLPKIGFVWFIGGTAALLCVPLIPAIGTPVLWGLLPFMLGALWLLYFLLQKNYRDAEILEELTLWPDRLLLTRHNPKGAALSWEENPHWVRVTLHRSGGPVPNYITLSGKGREVEIGAFLSEEERIALHAELAALLPLRD
ncbi:DUF2244 domain-containing protein [Vannielia litorea]|uniref:DUF2244 domain-containing protein n=1 Tax=Vannielia litorea TaxID=1217970 RepID=UPI001BCB1950|nr:DUF2244 domain-containing protein [Vannielia litorea]MBS8227049.1 DUF2244 domain-containing protein [Vannielia litorea]